MGNETEEIIVSALLQPSEDGGGRLKFKRADVAAISASGIRDDRIVVRAQTSALIGRRAAAVALVDGRAARQQSHGPSRAAVVLQWAEPRIQRANQVRTFIHEFAD